MKKILTPFLALCYALGSPIAVQAAEQCPAIDCDCSSLPSEQWVNVCQQHETRIKQACVANENTPKDYCLVHGLNAKPLPLAIKASDFVESSENAAALGEKISTVQWAIQTDSQEAVEAFEKGKFARTMQILKLVDANIENVSALQQQANAAHDSEGSSKKVKKVFWKDFSEKSLKYATDIESFGNMLADQIDSASTPKQKKIYSVLSQKAFRVAGKGFEQTGFAYGSFGKHGEAAKAWKQGADLSVKLAGINHAAGKASGVKFAEFQAAARLHRASYHWLKGKNIDGSNQILRESQRYVDREQQQNIEMLVNNVEENDQGALTGR